MKTKKILAMLLSAMIVMSTTAVSVSAEVCDGTNHNFSNGVCTNDECEATCNCNNTGATCTTAGTCSVCGKEGEPLGHTELVEKEAAVAATCTTAGKTAVMGCSRCADINEGGEETDALGHNYTVDVADASNKAATCTAAGSQMKKCSRCEATEAQEIAQLQHSYVGEYKYDAEGTTHTRKCTNGCGEYGAEETCDNTETDCVCGRAKKVVEPEPEPECAHESTKYVQVGDAQHKQECTADDCGYETTAVDCEYTENDGTECVCGRAKKVVEPEPEPECAHESTKYVQVGDAQHKQECTADDCGYETTAVDCEYTENDGTECVCGRTMASQEPGDIKIEAVVVYVGEFAVGEKLPAVNTDQDEFTVSYTWYEEADEPIELENNSIIEAKDYKCQVIITPKSGYTLAGLTKATVEGFTNPEHDLKVETDGTGSFCIEISKSDEPEDKPTTGGSSSSSSSSSSTTTPSTDTKANTDKIANAKAGEKVEVKLEGKVVPADYIKSAQTSKAVVVVDYGAYAWEISNVTEAKAVDLSINTDAKYLVNQNELKALKGDNSNVIDIAHDGKLGFKGTLKYNVDKKNAGKFVNLYYYNPTTKKLELQGSTKIGADGNVFLPFTHCSTYVLNITDKAASAELFEDFSAGESATVVEETLPAATNAPAATEAPAQTEAAANPATGNSAAALVAIPVAIAAAAIISKKR